MVECKCEGCGCVTNLIVRLGHRNMILCSDCKYKIQSQKKQESLFNLQ